jgi:hypothetical protein
MAETTDDQKKTADGKLDSVVLRLKLADARGKSQKTLKLRLNIMTAVGALSLLGVLIMGVMVWRLQGTMNATTSQLQRKIDELIRTQAPPPAATFFASAVPTVTPPPPEVTP